MVLGFPDHDRVALLQNFMYGYKSFKCLHFVREDGLTVRARAPGQLSVTTNEPKEMTRR